MNITSLLESQRNYFATGATKDVEFRLAKLAELKKAILANADRIVKARYDDIQKPENETYLTEILFVIKKIDFAIKHLRSWAKPEKVPSSPFVLSLGKSFVYSEPKGCCLIIGAANYALTLTISPLIGAIAAGNCVILKTSERAPATSQLVLDILSSIFDKKYIAGVPGGIATNKAVLEEKFDHIFFTGSHDVAKIIAVAAAKNLTPTTLELGGKCPTIIDADANITTTAERLGFAKFHGSGQTCFAPDYVVVHESLKEQLIEKLREYIKMAYGDEPLKSPDIVRIMGKPALEKLVGYLNKGTIRAGGKYDMGSLLMEPTIIDDVQWGDPVMQYEIFGPILPIISYSDLNEVLEVIRRRPKPLAMYIFAKNKDVQDTILTQVQSGDTSINIAEIHILNDNLPFGGIGDSGMGNYHGKFGFDTFSHKRGVLKYPAFNLPFLKIVYPPYNKEKLRMIKSIFG